MQNEVHIKIGGDHGGKSFKMSYQVSSTLALFLEGHFCYSLKSSKIFNRMSDYRILRSSLDIGA